MENNMTTTNVSTGNLSIKLGEITFKGFTLKNVEAVATATVTDENVRVQTNAAFEMLQSVLGQIMPEVVRSIRSTNDLAEIRKKEIEAEIELTEAKTAKIKAETKKINEQTETSDKTE